jgi:hypothetical protein
MLSPARLFSISASSTIPLIVATAQTLRSRKAVLYIVMAVRTSDPTLQKQICFYPFRHWGYYLLYYSTSLCQLLGSCGSHWDAACNGASRGSMSKWSYICQEGLKKRNDSKLDSLFLIVIRVSRASNLSVCFGCIDWSNTNFLWRYSIRNSTRCWLSPTTWSVLALVFSRILWL